MQVSLMQRQPLLRQCAQRGRAITMKPCRLTVRSSGNGASQTVSKLQPGARVKVVQDIKVYHVGKFKQGLNLKDLEGTVLSDEADYHDKGGKPIKLSANLPWKVQFAVPGPDGKDVKVLAHLADDEVQVL